MNESSNFTNSLREVLSRYYMNSLDVHWNHDVINFNRFYPILADLWRCQKSLARTFRYHLKKKFTQPKQIVPSQIVHNFYRHKSNFGLPHFLDLEKQNISQHVVRWAYFSNFSSKSNI